MSINKWIIILRNYLKHNYVNNLDCVLHIYVLSFVEFTLLESSYYLIT